MWLVFKDSGMSNGEHGLKRAEKDNEGRDQHREFFHRRRGHQGEYLLEDEYDEEFWIKVKEPVSKFIWKFFREMYCHTIIPL